ncbi:MAG TPA: hypothetical protein VMI92_11050 [Steroidobacteraceae bacterium]|nr:hypothetical protein [Steroidobacteraceae bacterium]
MTDHPRPPEGIIVQLDHYVVVREDRLLCARLAGSFAVCLSDEVFDSGALLHMQAGRPGRSGDAELTDNTLSLDLLLLDRCLAQLRAIEPQARHWQARFVAHVDPDAGGHERMLGLRAFFEAAMEDTGIVLAGGGLHDGPAQWLAFRPALRQLRCEPFAGQS